MLTRRRIPCAIVTTLLASLTFLGLYVVPTAPSNVGDFEELPKWIASSSSWLDRKACGWFGVCGTSHLNSAYWRSRIGNDGRAGKPNWQWFSQEKLENDIDLKDFWIDATTNPSNWSKQERILREIPEYVIQHAPYVHLYSGEQFWPCDIAEHLLHTTPHLNYTPVQSENNHPNLTNLDDLNKWGRFVYLQSNDNVEDRPEWLGGKMNIPTRPNDGDEDDRHLHWNDDMEDELQDLDDWWEVGEGDTRDKGGIRPAPGSEPDISIDGTPYEEFEDLKLRSKQHSQPEKTAKRTPGGHSDAPAVLVVVDKGEGIVDAFWFFFYSYNLGNVVFNVRFGNHVGDWEHTVVRFKNGKPKAVFLSEHNFGEAYTYSAVEKISKRPVIYSATGTHAMYATPGTHPYVLPWGLLHDETDRGPLWDPALNFHGYTYDYKNDTLRASNLTPYSPINWFYFFGRWGDKFYPLSDNRQYRFVGQYHYVSGPLGPRFKNLGRRNVCQGNGECLLKRRLGESQVKRWVPVGEGEDLDEEQRTLIEGAENAK